MSVREILEIRNTMEVKELTPPLSPNEEQQIEEIINMLLVELD